ACTPSTASARPHRRLSVWRCDSAERSLGRQRCRRASAQRHRSQPRRALSATRRKQLVREVVTVLLGVEPAPGGLPGVGVVGGASTEVGLCRAEYAVDGRITVRYVQTGDLVVAVVLTEPAERRVDRGGGVASLSQPARGLRTGRVVGRDVPRVAGVERVPLP